MTKLVRLPKRPDGMQRIINLEAVQHISLTSGGAFVYMAGRGKFGDFSFTLNNDEMNSLMKVLYPEE